MICEIYISWQTTLPYIQRWICRIFFLFFQIDDNIFTVLLEAHISTLLSKWPTKMQMQAQSLLCNAKNNKQKKLHRKFCRMCYMCTHVTLILFPLCRLCFGSTTTTAMFVVFCSIVVFLFLFFLVACLDELDCMSQRTIFPYYVVNYSWMLSEIDLCVCVCTRW